MYTDDHFCRACGAQNDLEQDTKDDEDDTWTLCRCGMVNHFRFKGWAYFWVSTKRGPRYIVDEILEMRRERLGLC